MKEAFELLLMSIENNKPNDRSPRDRHFAILLTSLEKAYAYFVVYVNE